jgi:hypothetical protein
MSDDGHDIRHAWLDLDKDQKETEIPHRVFCRSRRILFLKMAPSRRYTAPRWGRGDAFDSMAPCLLNWVPIPNSSNSPIGPPIELGNSN